MCVCTHKHLCVYVLQDVKEKSTPHLRTLHPLLGKGLVLFSCSGWLCDITQKGDLALFIAFNWRLSLDWEILEREECHDNFIFQLDGATVPIVCSGIVSMLLRGLLWK